VTVGVPAVARLPWDTDYFGFEVGRLEGAGDRDRMASALAAGDAAGIECTYLLVPGDDHRRLAAAQELGFRVVDVRTELARPVQPQDRDGAGPGSIAGPDDAAWVEELAAGRFAHSRFVADGRFPLEAAHGLFRRWVQRGFSSAGQEVLVLPERAGFVIVGCDGRRGSIELIAAGPSAPRGSGAALLQIAHRHMLEAGCTVADVVTQATNVPALRLYERAGYRVTASSYWLHRWRSERHAPPPRGR
jgi:ribosomal protein S18 acetylase RimI-like enzyme